MTTSSPAAVLAAVDLLLARLDQDEDAEAVIVAGADPVACIVGLVAIAQAFGLLACGDEARLRAALHSVAVDAQLFEVGRVVGVNGGQ